MTERRTLVLLGAMADMPVAGVAWQVLHYLEGFRRLGHDVHYVEDTGRWPYDPFAETVTDDATGTVRRLGPLLERFGFGDRWAFRNAAREGEWHGRSGAEVDALLARADVLVNLSGATVLAEPHMQVPVRVYLETDPVTPQLEIAAGNEFTVEMLAAHTHHFTFGERLGRPDCPVPVERFAYRPTRQPVILDWWEPAAPPADPFRFTTIASWEQAFKDIEFGGQLYTWSKSAEFRKVMDLPGRVPVRLELALALDDEATLAELRSAGWEVRPAAPFSDDPDAYRDYIQGSGGEFTAAKDQNVRLRSGWFSDRTATYLAAGRPAVVQDTGFDCALPVGEGLLAWRDGEEAAAALAAVAADPARHARAARAIADEHFRAETVLARLLDQVGA